MKVSRRSQQFLTSGGEGSRAASFSPCRYRRAERDVLSPHNVFFAYPDFFWTSAGESRPYLRTVVRKAKAATKIWRGLERFLVSRAPRSAAVPWQTTDCRSVTHTF